MCPDGAKPRNLRKTPRQERSERTRQDLLAGATRVLERAGPDAFTTNRVAEAAGVSIGSLYQYYPNGAALLADLHAHETEHLWASLAGILRDDTLPARQRFEQVIVLSLLAQNGAAAQHRALEQAGTPASETPELASLEERAVAELEVFLRAAVPGRQAEAGFLARSCVETLLGTMERLARKPWAEAEANRFAANLGAMLATHVGL